jgi:outer membrane murein-binding lipoprotein Lpp
MKKVYIPIIVILFVACVFTIVQWQVAGSQLQKCQIEVQSLTSEVDQLQFLTDQQQSEIQAQEEEVERVKFKFYYASLTKQRYGVSGLEEYLNRWQWTEGAYVAGEFDCSEMSAYLEWKLENEGYNTLIVTGDSPFGLGKHAWLLVQTSVEGYMPVEATTYSIIYWSDIYFDNYFVYDHQFENIQEALDYSPNEFDWWN